MSQAEELAKLVLTASDEVSTGAARRAKLRSAAAAAVRVLEITDKDIGPKLKTLLTQVKSIILFALPFLWGHEMFLWVSFHFMFAVCSLAVLLFSPGSCVCPTFSSFKCVASVITP